MINRILERLEEELNESGVIDDDDYFLGKYTAYNDAISIVKEESQNGGWIPCGVRLPEEPEFSWKGYLVQCEDVREPYTAFWNGVKWEDAHGEEETGIIAWMPLPDRYKGE